MKSKTISYQDITVTVQEADGVMGFRRQLLANQAFQPDPVDPKKIAPVYLDDALQIMKLVAYPDMTSCLVESQGLPDPLTFEDFAHLPDALLDLWGKAVYELNPHWLNLPADEKKA